MKLHIILNPFSKADTNFLKGVSILLIALHNYYRWVNPITGENEFWFSTANYIKSFITLRSNPLEFFNVFFNFLGFYGVQGFILISAYGLTISYRKKHPGYGKFILERFNKLYPTFFFAAVLLVVFMILQNGKLIELDHLKDIGLQLTLLANFFPGKAMSACGPWWFYSFIFQFYLIFPFLMWIVDKWNVKGLITVAILGYIMTILVYSPMVKADLNPYMFVFGHLPEFTLGIFLAIRKEVKIPLWVIALLLLVFIAGNIYSMVWPFANLAAALLLWIAVSRWLSVLKPGTLTLKIIAFIGMVSMYIFAIQGFTRWNFINLANTLYSPFSSLILGLFFMAFATGIAYLMMISENGIRSWISSAGSARRRYLRFFLLPLLALAALTVLFLTNSSVAARELKTKNQSIILASDSNTFESIVKEKSNRYSTNVFFSGSRSFCMPPPESFSPRLEVDFGKIDPKRLIEVDATVMMFTTDSLSSGHLVMEVYDKKTNERLVWKSTHIKPGDFSQNSWFSCSYKYAVPKEYLFPEYLIRVYVWNNAKGLFYIDNMKVEAIGFSD